MSVLSAIQAESVKAAEIDDDTLYEVIDGVRVEVPWMGAYQGNVASILVAHLVIYALQNRSGGAVDEVLFMLGPAFAQRRPDVAFVSYERWPKEMAVPDTNSWEVVPDVTAEVVSPSNKTEEDLQKVLEYFRAGVRLVWVIHAKARQIYVYDSPTQIRVLATADVLDGGTVLPGFQLSVATLFEEHRNGETL
jgi:Uma2 family endonuclease